MEYGDVDDSPCFGFSYGMNQASPCARDADDDCRKRNVSDMAIRVATEIETRYISAGRDKSRSREVECNARLLAGSVTLVLLGSIERGVVNVIGIHSLGRWGWPCTDYVTM